MDIVIQGKITAEEGMSDVLQTVLDLKNIPNPVLRISESNSTVNGRIAFATGGFIVGGRTGNSDEQGYPAIRQLLSVRDGNYAILDAGKASPADCNQTLWIDCQKIMAQLDELPESPENLLDMTAEQLQSTKMKSVIGPMSLKTPAAGERPDKFSKKTRSFNQKKWAAIQVCIWLVLLSGATFVAYKYSNQIVAFLQKLMGH